jgi:hypothetical protein
MGLQSSREKGGQPYPTWLSLPLAVQIRGDRAAF